MNKSYQDMVTGSSNIPDISMEVEEDLSEDYHKQEGGEMKIVESKVGEYECPTFVLSELEEKRIPRPWRR